MKLPVFAAFLFLVFSMESCDAQSQPEPTASSDLVWYTELTKAQAASNESNKPIFAFFTGSDWCGWCKKLQADVFAKDAFKEWARQNVVLLELDFPRRKQLAPEIAQQNMNLQQSFQVRGYPTIWIFYAQTDPATNGISLNALGSTGYPAGAKKGKEEVKFLSEVNAILANGKR
ncbi:MAG: thioredoxin fold domain-containing protein [Bacteroidetes bacterium]|nr:thioredoxin fold domain-containing protein [Bacteroidota bacterium]